MINSIVFLYTDSIKRNKTPSHHFRTGSFRSLQLPIITTRLTITRFRNTLLWLFYEIYIICFCFCFFDEYSVTAGVSGLLPFIALISAVNKNRLTKRWPWNAQLFVQSRCHWFSYSSGATNAYGKHSLSALVLECNWKYF